MKSAKMMLVVVLVAMGAILSGCSSIGANTVARDRFEYTNAISESWKRQMLLNMVKIRYGDAPVFLDVSSVINQYLLETELDGQLTWNRFLSNNSQAVGARGKYADRPTITYQPLQGEKFTRSLMTPIQPDSLFSLIEAGWRVDYLFRLCIQSVNGIYNHAGYELTEKAADPEFYPLLESLRKIQKSAAFGMRLNRSRGAQPATILFFRKKNVGADIVAEQENVLEMLGLDPQADEFTIVYGAVSTSDTEIAILSRSMLQIMSELSSYIEVPQKHIDENRAGNNYAAEVDEAAGVTSLVQVHSGHDKPDDAFVAIEYRDHWFWIDDTDFFSKRMFSFLMYLFTLAESGSSNQAPVLTIPTG